MQRSVVKDSISGKTEEKAISKKILNDSSNLSKVVDTDEKKKILKVCFWH